MKFLVVLIPIFFISFHSQASYSSIDILKKHFCGVEVSGFFNNSVKTVEGGMEFRFRNVIHFISIRYYSDEQFSMYGLGPSFQYLFPISKFKVIPLFHLSSFLNYAKSNNNIELSKGQWFIGTIAPGAGLHFELSKYLQIVTTINYEMINIFGPNSDFYFHPLVNLKYEFKFSE